MGSSGPRNMSHEGNLAYVVTERRKSIGEQLCLCFFLLSTPFLFSQKLHMVTEVERSLYAHPGPKLESNDFLNSNSLNCFIGHYAGMLAWVD